MAVGWGRGVGEEGWRRGSAWEEMEEEDWRSGRKSTFGREENHEEEEARTLYVAEGEEQERWLMEKKEQYWEKKLRK